MVRQASLADLSRCALCVWGMGVGVLDVVCFCEGGCVVCMYVFGCPCVYAHENPTIHVVHTYSTYVDSKVKSLSVGTIKK